MTTSEFVSQEDIEMTTTHDDLSLFQISFCIDGNMEWSYINNEVVHQFQIAAQQSQVRYGTFKECRSKMIKQKEAIFFIVMIILSFAVSSAAPYLNGKFIDLLTVSKDIHLIVQFALIIVGVGVVGALLSYCSNLTTVKVLTKTTMASIYEGMDNLLETDLVIAEKLGNNAAACKKTDSFPP